MAQSDELAKQLALMNKINAVVQSIANNEAAVTKAIAGQSEFAQKTLAMMQQLQGLNLEGKFAGINDVLTESASKLASFNGNPMAAMTKGAEEAGDEFETMAKKLAGAGKKAGVVAVAFKGMAKGFMNFVNLGKGVIGLASSITSGLVNVAASIVAIPLDLLTGFVNLAVKSANGMLELRRALEEVRGEFGEFGGPASHAVLVATKAMTGLRDTGLSAWKVFGTMAERMEAVRKAATAMGSTFSVLNQEFVDNGGAVLAYQRGLGAADEDLKSLGQRSIVYGDKLSKTLNNIAKQSLSLGKSFGLDQKLIGRSIAQATKDVRHFGTVTVKEIGVAAVYARKLGVELDKITGTLDAFETFDTAAENSAKLSQAFGVQVDAFKLMSAQNPAEQIDMLRQSFKAAGVDASKLNRQQLKLLSSTTGLDDATAQAVFSSKNYGVSLKEVQKQAAVNEKKTLSQADAMHELSDSIKRMVKEGQPLVGSFWQMFVRGFAQGIQWSRPFQKVLMNIRTSLRITQAIGRDFGRALVDMFPGVKQILKGASDIFDPKKFRTMRKELLPLWKSLLTGQATFKQFADGVQGIFRNLFNSDSGPIREAFKGLQKIFIKMADLIGDALPWVGEKMAQVFTVLTNILSGKTPLEGFDTSGISAFWSRIAGPVIAGAKTAWEKIKTPMKDLGEIALKRLTEVLTSDAAMTAYKAIGAAFITSVLGSMTTSLLQAAAWKAVSSALGAGLSALMKTSAVQTAIAGGAEKMAGMLLGKFALGFTPVALAVAAAGIGYAIGTMLNDYLGLDKIISDWVSKYTDKGQAVTKSRAKMEVPKGATGYAHGFYEQDGKLMGGDGDKETEARLQKMIADRGKTKAQKEKELAAKKGDPRGPHVIQMPEISIVGATKDRSLRDAVDPSLENIGNQLKRQAAQMKIAQAALVDMQKNEPALTAAFSGGAVQRSFNAITGVAEASQKLNASLGNLGNIGNFTAITTQLPKFASAVKNGAVKTALDAVKNITAMVQSLDDALAATPNIDIATKLGSLAQGSGMGSKAQYTVKSKEIVINLNLTVTMDVDKVEKVMIMRKESIIRDRLEFATIKNPGAQGNNSLPETYTENVPNITKR